MVNEPFLRTTSWMAAAVVSFSSIAVGARELSGEMHVFQMLFARSVVGLLIMTVLLLLFYRKNPFRTPKLKAHVLRNVFHFGGQYGWFVGIAYLPLAEVFALEFTVPVWASLFAYFLLGERLTQRKCAGIVLGIVGVLFVVRPGIEIVQPASFVVLAAAIGFALTHVTTRSLAGSESTLVIVFFMCLIQLPIGGLLSLSVWKWPTSSEIFWLVWIGISALLAHYCMTRALYYASVSTVLTIDFLRLPFIALVAMWLYDENLDMWVLMGGAIMVLGNVIGLGKGKSRQSLTE